MSLTFKQIDHNEPVQEVIKSAFDTTLPIANGWGYTEETATHITSTEIPYAQLEHMFASMRAYLEMHMTLSDEERYGSINLNETRREELQKEGNTYHKVTYEITAMKESLYNDFIKEYKEHYGKESFDLSAHFQRRKEATLHREVTHWFKIA